MKHYWRCNECDTGPCNALTNPCLRPNCLYIRNELARWRKSYSWRIQIWTTWILCVVTLIALWFGVGGCTTIEYNPETNAVKYQSFGGKEFDSLDITKTDTGDILIEVNKFKGEPVAEVAGKIAEGIVRGMGGGV